MIKDHSRKCDKTDFKILKYPVEDLIKWCESNSISTLVLHRHKFGTPLQDIARLLRKLHEEDVI